MGNIYTFYRIFLVAIVLMFLTYLSMHMNSFPPLSEAKKFEGEIVAIKISRGRNIKKIVALSNRNGEIVLRSFGLKNRWEKIFNSLKVGDAVIVYYFRLHGSKFFYENYIAEVYFNGEYLYGDWKEKRIELYDIYGGYNTIYIYIVLIFSLVLSANIFLKRGVIKGIVVA